MNSIKQFLIISTSIILSLIALIYYVYLLIVPSLPPIDNLSDYRPKEPLQVFTKEGDLIAEFGEEHRDFIKIDNVPQKMINAIIATEDRRFFEHNGIDFVGIFRATYKTLLGISFEGASTITMQVARNFFLTSDKTIKRKISEILLSLEIEKYLSKEQILELYMNQIYLGQRSFGFNSAANTYFSKNLNELNTAEMALLAGLPKAPSRYNPFNNYELAIKRQKDVLASMLRHGFIDEPTYIIALDEQINLKESKMKKDVDAEFVAEMVRKDLFDEFGEKIYSSGLKVFTTIKSSNQKLANLAVRDGIINYINRHQPREADGIFDLKNFISNEKIENEEELKKEVIIFLKKFSAYGDFIPGVITKLQPLEIEAILKDGRTINVYKKGLKLIENDKGYEDQPKEYRRIREGGVFHFTKKRNEWIITQLPKVESALIAMDPNSGEINALVGGFDFQKNKFNHITQAYRQPGSIFKPFIYSAAIEKGVTPATLVNDNFFFMTADELMSKENWEPKNYNDKYEGPTRLRVGLSKSKNMVAIRTLKYIEPKYAQDYVTRFGFDKKKIPPFLSLALGVAEVKPINLISAFAVFANGGYLKEPYYIDKIIDSNDREIKLKSSITNEDTPRIIDPRNAFIMDSMLKDVIKDGTAKRARILKRTDIAGKTGTTNDLVDAWFVGYNPDHIALTWFGYDTPQSLGEHETGSRAALPIWIDYMKGALDGLPEKIYAEPEGIIPHKINPVDGTLTSNDDESGIYEYFYEEFYPQDNAFFMIN
ncbi:MrcA penicillin-binding 1 (peptidoglycan synthetase) transmembrane protein [beta proteobacterium KB13]|uniref:Penicillin-binding protein 1A n=1 Tax=beta proteobacterium KB13 TaxID=314607 RepID=B6BW48_9PROT|nr:MrcA penicillin-binding 1 (peptidoglycan synthetase) transmembrane protein [beta proteobacterium KB13]